MDPSLDGIAQWARVTGLGIDWVSSSCRQRLQLAVRYRLKRHELVVAPRISKLSALDAVQRNHPSMPRRAWIIGGTRHHTGDRVTVFLRESHSDHDTKRRGIRETLQSGA